MMNHLTQAGCQQFSKSCNRLMTELRCTVANRENQFSILDDSIDIQCKIHSRIRADRHTDGIGGRLQIIAFIILIELAQIVKTDLRLSL
ncbi:hypothetical protein D1872_234640 [compost metagenome]